MSKSVLGRGLSTLLNEGKENPSHPPTETSGASEPHIGPGVEKLLLGSQHQEQTPGATAATPAQIRWLTVVLAATDLWLCAGMILILLRSKSLGLVEILLCASIMFVGALLGSLAVWLHSKN